MDRPLAKEIEQSVDAVMTDLIQTRNLDTVAICDIADGLLAALNKIMLRVSHDPSVFFDRQQLEIAVRDFQLHIEDMRRNLLSLGDC